VPAEATLVHPMFGPDTELLSGRHVVFVDLGSAEALASARELFSPTMAEQVVMSLDDHDRLIAYVLGLSHALNIAFFTALAESGEAAPKLARMSSTTFDSQLDVASRVAHGYVNLGDSVGRMLVVAPAAQEGLFDDLAEAIATRDPARMAAFTAHHQVEILSAERS